jgi:hypothetical protein
MNDDIPVVDGKPLDAEDKRLIALFDKMEEGQLDFLDQASKRIVELSSAMLAILFTVTAFGKDFPPPYLKGHALVQGVALATLAFFVLSLLVGFVAVQPRRYERSRYSLTEQQRELDRMLAFKMRWFRIGSVLFFAGALALAVLVAAIVWGA